MLDIWDLKWFQAFVKPNHNDKRATKAAAKQYNDKLTSFRCLQKDTIIVLPSQGHFQQFVKG